MGLILPLLTAIVLGCIDFGRFAHSHIAVTNAARAGAGFASFHPVTATTQPVWEQRTREAVVAELGDTFDATKIDMPSPVMATDSDGLKRVSVQVTYPFETLVDWPGIPSQMNLSRTVEMRVIR